MKPAGLTPWKLDELFGVFALELVDVHHFRAATFPSRLKLAAGERAVVDGSQLLGQAIVAAQQVEPERFVKSAHMIFSRPAFAPEPVELAVECTHAGRSFASLLATVEQSGKLCARGMLLLDGDEPNLIEHEPLLPDAGDPETGSEYDALVEGRDVRIVEGADYPDPDQVGPPHLDVWVRYAESPKERAVRQAVIAQFCGRHTIGTAMRPHKGYGEAAAHRTISTGVLSLTVHFHEDRALDDWLLYSHDALHAGRGLCDGHGRVFHRSGTLLASFEQEAMVRPLPQATARRDRENAM